MTLTIRRRRAETGSWCTAWIERPADGSRTLVAVCPWLMVRVTV